MLHGFIAFIISFSPLYTWPVFVHNRPDCQAVAFRKLQELLDKVSPVQMAESCGGRGFQMLFDKHLVEAALPDSLTIVTLGRNTRPKGESGK